MVADGAGAWCEPEGRIAHCVITDCSADGYGGGIYQGIISNSLIYANTAMSDGDGACYSTLFNCTIVDNENEDSYDCKQINSIIYDIEGQEDFRPSLVQYVCTDSDPGGIAVIEDDPLFVDSTTGNYHLQSASPCIDSGTNLTSLTDDLDGLPRPLDGDSNNTAVVDMGCYEYLNHTADTDGDTMPDGWEADNGTDPTVDDASANPDSDPFNNLQEFIADTDPTDPTDWFRITAVSNTSAGSEQATVYFKSSGNRLYTLLGCSNLLDNAWTNVPGCGPIGGNGGADSMTDTNVPDKGPFYRMKVELNGE